MNARIISFSESIEPEISSPAPDRLIAGQPQQRIWNYFADPTGQFFTGRWSSTRGKWHVRYTENELCMLTEGCVRITGSDGRVCEYRAGEAFMIPAGFEGTWEVVEDCTKLYAIFEATAPR
jgi:uncharacterized cupin superfamily protein